MQRTRTHQKAYGFGKRQIALVVGAITLMIIILLALAGNKVSLGEEKSQGLEYLDMLEDRDIGEIKGKLKEIKAKRNLEMADSNEEAIWPEFEDSLILGDSRAVGFSYYEFLSEEQVLAKGGGIITDVSNEYLEQVKQINPERVFLCFGLNDMGIGFWPQPQDYAEECRKQIQALNQASPDTEVYINSILPPVGVGLDADPNYKNYGEYNAAIQEMCETEGFHYVDNSEISEAHQDLYQPDGLHMQTDFYKYWAANMLAEVDEE